MTVTELQELLKCVGSKFEIRLALPDSDGGVKHYRLAASACFNPIDLNGKWGTGRFILYAEAFPERHPERCANLTGPWWK